jgi:hypothetical protein
LKGEQEKQKANSLGLRPFNLLRLPLRRSRKRSYYGWQEAKKEQRA